MRRVEIIVSFILIILITTSGGCINSPQVEKPESPVIETTHGGVDEHVSENTSQQEKAKAAFPMGTFKPKRLDWLSYPPENPISEVVSRISEKYNVTESFADILMPPESLASFTGTAAGIEFGLFAYPNSTAVAKAMNDVVELLTENGFRQGDGNFWERGNETHTVFYTYEPYFYVLLVAKADGGDSEERAKLLSEFAWSFIMIGPGPGKVLGLFLPVKVAEDNWSEDRGLRFSGYLDALEGTVEGTNVSVVFLVYRPYEGREVYLQLKKAFLKNGWVEREFINTHTRNPAGYLVASDFLEGDGVSAYIELARQASLERLTILVGNGSEVRKIVSGFWSLEPYLSPTPVLSQKRAPELPALTFRPLGERYPKPSTVIRMVLDDLRKNFNITADFVDIPEVSAADWYTGRTGDVEFMFLVYPNVSAYFEARDELTKKLLANGWERTDDGSDPYYRSFVKGEDTILLYAQYRYDHYIAIALKKSRYSTNNLFWHVVGTGGASPETLLSFGELKGKVKPENWTVQAGLRFEGYVYALEGEVNTWGNVKAVVLFYPDRLGHEVYLRLKKALLDNGWVESDYAELPSHDGMRHLLAKDLFGSSERAVYIEV
ncbi:hypothetical protein [Thermococcus thermotolerans]|uniref:hypothetical protein n=1 Tax=Thermococcus thermotolerans TaxID=2969672 RepID=UPI00215859E0|nr:hypothetical protein [Thermococcus thermotolerans]